MIPNQIMSATPSNAAAVLSIHPVITTRIVTANPRRESMEGFLDHVDKAYGGPHALALSLGVREEDVARLGVRLLGTSPSVR
jgi:hypothetical protein